jgi:hypothetical protein
MATTMIRRILAGGGVLALFLSSWALAEDGTEATDPTTNAGAEHRAEVANTKIAAASDETTAEGHEDDGDSTLDAEVTGHPSAEDLPEAAAFGMCVSDAAPADAPEGGDNPAETCADLKNGAGVESETTEAETETDADAEDADDGDDDGDESRAGGQPETVPAGGGQPDDSDDDTES